MRIVILFFIITLALYANHSKDLKIGYLSTILENVGKKDLAKKEIEEYFETLKNKSDIKVSYNFYKDSSIIRDFKNGKLNMIFIDGFTYLENYTNLDKYVFKYLGVTQGNQEYTSLLLVVNARSKINLISDLENSAFSMQKNDKLSEMFLKYILKKYKLGSADTFFSQIIYKDTPSRVLFSIFFNRSKGCIIQENNYKKEIKINSQIKDKTKILEKSPPMHYIMALVRRDLTDNVLNVINSRMEKVSNELLRGSFFMIHNIKEIKREDLKDIQKFYNNIFK